MSFGGGCRAFGGGPEGGFGPGAGTRLDDAVALLGSGACASPLDSTRSSILDLSFALLCHFVFRLQTVLSFLPALLSTLRLSLHPKSSCRL